MWHHQVVSCKSPESGVASVRSIQVSTLRTMWSGKLKKGPDLGRGHRPLDTREGQPTSSVSFCRLLQVQNLQKWLDTPGFAPVASFQHEVHSSVILVQCSPFPLTNTSKNTWKLHLYQHKYIYIYLYYIYSFFSDHMMASTAPVSPGCCCSFKQQGVYSTFNSDRAMFIPHSV